jgi:hypothetical protein
MSDILKASGIFPSYTMFDRFIDVEFKEYLTDHEIAKRFAANTGLLSPAGKNFSGSRVKIHLTGEEAQIMEQNETHRYFITTPTGGVKPDISLSATFIPKNHTTAVTVSIRNLNTQVDITRMGYMNVTAGYLSGQHLSISGPIINSYIESPNPNGTTVFQLVDAGSIGNVVTLNDTYVVTSGGVTFEEAAISVCELTGMTPIIYLPDAYKKIRVSKASASRKFKNPLDAMNWLRLVAQNTFGALRLPIPYIDYNKDNVITIATMVWATTSEYEAKETPILRRIKTASFTGGSLVIKAPWWPGIRPDGLFKMNPRYFRGRLNSQMFSELNTMLSPEQQTRQPGESDLGLYRCIQMSLQFGSYSNNEMQITAIASISETEDAKNELYKELNEKVESKNFVDINNPFFRYPPGIVPEYFQRTENGTENEGWHVRNQLYLPDDVPLAKYTAKEGDTMSGLFGPFIQTGYRFNPDIKVSANELIGEGNVVLFPPDISTSGKLPVPTDKDGKVKAVANVVVIKGEGGAKDLSQIAPTQDVDEVMDKLFKKYVDKPFATGGEEVKLHVASQSLDDSGTYGSIDKWTTAAYYFINSDDPNYSTEKEKFNTAINQYVDTIYSSILDVGNNYGVYAPLYMLSTYKVDGTNKKNYPKWHNIFDFISDVSIQFYVQAPNWSAVFGKANLNDVASFLEEFSDIVRSFGDFLLNSELEGIDKLIARMRVIAAGS